ncbi:MAG: TonB-dependent receptor plug domain-containing protein [Methylocystis sp.]
MSRIVPLVLLIPPLLVLSAPADAVAKHLRARHRLETAPGSYYTPWLSGPDGRRIPIMEVPGSAVIINRQILDDQQVRTLGEALQNVSGVTLRH